MTHTETLPVTWVIEHCERNAFPQYHWVENGKRNPVYGWTDWRESEIGENAFETAEDAERAVEELMQTCGFWMDGNRIVCRIRVISSDGDVFCSWKPTGYKASIHD